MGRKPNTEQRREQIVQALLAEMAEVGYERASIKSIAARAALAPGLLHYHFASKEEILLALIDGLIVEADRRCDEALASSASSAQKLAAYICARLGRGGEDAERQVRAWVVMLAEATTQELVRARLAQWLARDQARLRAWFGECGDAEPATRAAAVLAMLLGSFSLHALGVAGVPMGYAEPHMLQWLDSVVRAARRKRAGTVRAKSPARR